MNQEQAQKIAADLFPHYPGQESFHITNDGQAFFTPADAENHNKKLQGEVIEINRAGEVVVPKETEEETAPHSAAPLAPKTPEAPEAPEEQAPVKKGTKKK